MPDRISETWDLTLDGSPEAGKISVRVDINMKRLVERMGSRAAKSITGVCRAGFVTVTHLRHKKKKDME